MKNCKVISVFLAFLVSMVAHGKSFVVDGYQIETSVGLDGAQFLVDGVPFDHSGRIRLKKSELFQSSGIVQPNQPQLFVIQFETQIFPGYRTWLEENGARVLRFVPDNALLIRTTPDILTTLAKAPQVRQVLAYDGAYKVVGISRTAWLSPPEFSQSFFDLLTVDESSRKSLLKKLEDLNIAIRHDGSESFAVTIQGNIEDVQRIASFPEIHWIEQAPEAIETDMDIVLITGGADSLTQNTGLYMGEGIRGHVLEGIYYTHQDFVADEYRDIPLMVGRPGQSSHGQATYGIVYGAGHGDPSAKGLMPRAQGFYTDYDHVYNKDNRKALSEELINDHQVMLQTASWGYPRTTEYNARSLEMDEIIFDLDFLVTQSQSNAGTRDSRPQAWAKNIVSVGAVNHGNNTDFFDDSWSRGGASIGPASDGRIKPDIVSYYDAIYTTSTKKYRTFGGTSAATPIVNGHLGLIVEMFTDGIFGNTLEHPKEERFLNRPHATTAKALLINSARQYEFQGGEHDLTRVHQGWGHPSLDRLYDNRKNMMIVNETELLEVLQTKEYELEVLEDTPQLAVTMIYNDPPGMVGAEYHRVNDLDIHVVSPDGQVFYGNHGLYEKNFSQEGGEKDSLNTVENVFVESPKPGAWKVVVTAAEVNQDGHLETDELDVDFALIVSGIKPI